MAGAGLSPEDLGGDPAWQRRKRKGVTWGPEREGPGGAACSQEERELG